MKLLTVNDLVLIENCLNKGHDEEIIKAVNDLKEILNRRQVNEPTTPEKHSGLLVYSRDSSSKSSSDEENYKSFIDEDDNLSFVFRHHALEIQPESKRRRRSKFLVQHSVKNIDEEEDSKSSKVSEELEEMKQYFNELNSQSLLYLENSTGEQKLKKAKIAGNVSEAKKKKFTWPTRRV